MIHYMTGSEVAYSKTGCGIHTLEGQEDFEYVFLTDRDKVTCPECLKVFKRPEFLMHALLPPDINPHHRGTDIKDKL